MSESGERLSFSAFWRKGKDKLKKGGSESSAEAAGAAGGEDGSTPPETKDTKAAKTQQSQARRAQVRSAQIRHRQRKANYQKQLELDISEYRELLSRVDAETAALRSQNATIVAKLREAGAGDQDLLLVLPSPHHQHDTVTPPPPPADGGKSQSLSPGWTDDSSRSPPGQQHHQATTPELFGGIDVNSLTVTLGMDEAMGTPTLHISPTASSAGESFGGTATSSLYSPSSCALEPTEPAQLTPLQEQTVINFILSLEHVCWNHFLPGDFSHHYSSPEQTYPVLGGGEHGHALMASTFCMSRAPDTVYDYSHSVFLASQQQQQQQGKNGAGGGDASPAQTQEITPAFTWQSPGLNLATLRGLASSLNPGDQDLTPVQAWFELASRYRMDVLLGPGVLDTLRVEFNGAVKCLAYGAVIERGAFESIISRVMPQFLLGF